MKNIKNIISTIVLSLCFISISIAQIGVKGGINFSSLNYLDDNEENFNEEYLTGYQVGLVYRANLGDKVSFQPEASFYTTGGSANLGGAGEVETTYSFINLNALVNLNLLGDNDGISLHVTGGLFGGYAIGSSVSTNILGTTTTGEIDFDDEDFNRETVGYILGVGLKLNDFIVSLRGSFGVNDLASFDSTFGSGETSYRTREFSLVGVFLF